MAYTYDNFVSDANAAGLMNRFSEQDLQVAQRNPEYGMSLLSLMKDNSNATTEEQRLLATEAANQLRKSYGINNPGTPDSAGSYGVYQNARTLGSAGSYGGSYDAQIGDLMGQINDYGSFDYENQDAYQQLLDGIVNQQPFSYDLEADPSWGSYKKAYMREGERASANALAQAAAASGGRASSYALTAAQQAGNYYAGQLADIIPTLEQNAYARYLSDFNNRLSGLSAMQSDREFDYENWMNEYNMMQNSLGNYQGQDATDYQRYLDQKAQEQQAYENALALYQALGYATPEVAKILGISSGYGGGSTGGGGSSGGSGGSNTKLDTTKAGNDNASDNLSVDMNSVLQLGYGPISEARLNELVESGEIEEYVEGNKIKFRKVEKTSPVQKGSYGTPGKPSSNTGTKASGSGTQKGSGGKKSGSGADGLKSQLDKVALLA